MAEADETPDIDTEQDNEREWLARLKPIEWLAVLVIVAGLIFLSFFFFQISVCDDQVTNSGKVEDVCRHPQLSDPPVAAVGLVILAFLGVFFSEISGFGFTLKRQVREARRDAREARRQARDALLAAEYSRIRATMPSGEARTQAMYKVFDEMAEELRGDKNFDLQGSLRSHDIGMRLNAYAYLCANPDQPWMPELVDIVLRPDKPFNQEMGLRALRLVINGDCGRLDDNVRVKLKTLAEERRRKDPESKRAREIDGIFEQCPE